MQKNTLRREGAFRLSVFSLIFITIMLSACSALESLGPEPVIQTVVVTLPAPAPLEITRLVEITREVEVTRQVVATELVYVPVTATPSPTPEATATATRYQGPRLTYTPTVGAPETKTAGFAPLKIVNKTNDTLSVEITGLVYHYVTLSGGDETFRTVREGRYTYVVFRDGKLIYRGEMNITNPDKYELHMKEDRGSFLVP